MRKMKKMLVISLSLVLIFGMTIIVGAAGNDSTVNQNGENLEAYVSQEGSSNNVLVDQIGNENTENHERIANINQKGTANDINLSQQKANFRAILNQEGKRNYIDLFQKTGSNAVIDQSGKDNRAVLSQFGPSFWNQNPAEKGAILNQEGNDNEFYGLSWLKDYWIGLNQSVSISNQIGNGNMIRLQQIGINNSYIDQNGNNNTANIYQGLEEASYENTRNMVDVYQYGNNNNLNSTQEGMNHEAYVYQGAKYSEHSWKRSNGNSATVNQKAETNWAGIGQYGNNNSATINQIAASNWAGIYQNGNGNSGIITQEGGSDNEGIIWQTGNNDNATINQDGTSNITQVNQE